MMPFLKHRQDAAMGDEDTGTRTPSVEYGMLDAVAEDLLEAIHQKDKALLRDALQAFCDYMQDADEEQDEEEME